MTKPTPTLAWCLVSKKHPAIYVHNTWSSKGDALRRKCSFEELVQVRIAVVRERKRKQAKKATKRRAKR